MQKVDIEQGSYEWHCLRQGKVTGTTLKSALGTPKVQETLMYKLISERMTEPKIEDLKAPAVVRGIEMEPIAKKKVNETLGVECGEIGALVSEDIPGFMFSPDGIYEDGGKVIGGLEIKCPDSKKHIEYYLKSDLPKDYEHQVMAPFLMSDDIEFWRFASFDDRNYEKPLFLMTVYRSAFPSLAEDREKLKAFIALVDEEHEKLTF